jgi:hypothetical protein
MADTFTAEWARKKLDDLLAKSTFLSTPKINLKFPDAVGEPGDEHFVFTVTIGNIVADYNVYENGEIT